MSKISCSTQGRCRCRNIYRCEYAQASMHTFLLALLTERPRNYDGCPSSKEHPSTRTFVPKTILLEKEPGLLEGWLVLDQTEHAK